MTQTSARAAARHQSTTRGPLLRAAAAALITTSVLFTVTGPVLTQQDHAKGPSTAICRFFPQLCGNW